MTVQDWQDRLDKEFPDGANVTQVVDVPEDTRDSYTFLTPLLKVLSVDSDDVPTVQVYPATFAKEVLFTIKVMDPYGNDGWLVTQADSDDPQFLLTRNFDAGIAKTLKGLREDRWAE